MMNYLFNKYVMNAQSMYFDPFMEVRSPYTVDTVRVVNHDENGNEYVTFEKFDSAKYQQSLGVAESWKLKELLKAGIDPSFPISTGYNTRLEGIDTLNEFLVRADELVNEMSNNKNVE